MTQEHCKLIFKRSQSKSDKPTFSLLVAAEMTPEFRAAAQDYGYWNECVYVDPKIEEEREDQLLKLERKRASTKWRANFWLSIFSGPSAIIFFPLLVVLKISMFIWTAPFKLAWWLFKARKAQAEQIIRLHELEQGKTITAHSIREIVAAEQMILENTEAIKTEVLAAMNYESDAFVPSAA